MKGIEQYFSVVLFISFIRWFNVLSLDEILKCDHSNESYIAPLSCGTVYHAEQGSSKNCILLRSSFLWSLSFLACSSSYLTLVLAKKLVCISTCVGDMKGWCSCARSSSF